MRVIIIGGGLAGVTTAYYLAIAGETVTVVEKASGVALETSFANAGLICPGHSYTWASPQAPITLIKSLFTDGQALRLKPTLDPAMYAWCWEFLKNCTNAKAHLFTSRKARLSKYSQRKLQELRQKEGLNFEGRSKGLLYLHRSQKALDLATVNMKVMTDNGLDLQALPMSKVVEVEPALKHLRDELAGGLYCPTDETGDAHLFTRALYARCVGLGVDFRFNTEVTGFETSGRDVASVSTTAGRLLADRFVIAAGTLSPRLAKFLGYKVPIYPVKGYSVTFPIDDSHFWPQVGGLDEHNLIAWAKFKDRLRFTGTAEFCGHDKSHRPEDFNHIIKAARQLFPDGADFSKPSYWAGLRPMTPSGTPILGRRRHTNLFFNTGHGHLGWTWSCGTATLVTDEMLGRKPELDFEDFS
ncbi:D-amino acid dehydrogenase [Phyllobacterium endophyticum]|uniref:Amino acid dehydrogenase n=1 Tax=Phyllobacterium endophyticum TaxID=1149773 RepID=A0A2P7AK98_9HYPH|nr:D-amino acid dehydrogenase [Phyllobacterium endophyticum]MBB3237124.1 D-amino-acid dehydrogenase [Phyllobacterium endophyticum]PSH54648.1 amino acid dehydrogenase [Phyllobacterium endophyticum]TYR40584.1 D-amino acid dehydrogenase [Phyllobacterium endophyticum]